MTLQTFPLYDSTQTPAPYTRATPVHFCALNEAKWLCKQTELPNRVSGECTPRHLLTLILGDIIMTSETNLLASALGPLPLMPHRHLPMIMQGSPRKHETARGSQRRLSVATKGNTGAPPPLPSVDLAEQRQNSLRVRERPKLSPSLRRTQLPSLTERIYE